MATDQHTANPVDFRILGPLEILVDGERLRLGLGGSVRERVLGILLMAPGRAVPVTRLVEAAWDEDPPDTASHQVRKAVFDLRQRLPGGTELIVTDWHGYRMALSADQLDLTVFNRLVREARATAASGRAEEAVARLRSALALWRGPVLSGAGGRVIEASAAILEERRLGAAEFYFELSLGLGKAAEIIDEVRRLTAEHPLRETLRGLLMLAYYWSGRQAEALEEYGRVRKLLSDELGIDPGPQLTTMYEGILRHSPDLAGPARPEAVGGPGRPTAPCTLPRDLADFTGRGRELRALLDAGAEPGDRRSTVVAIDGMGGSGKTSLAVRAAHLLADRYPDGQLYVELHGHTPGSRPQPAEVTAGVLLRALGVPASRIPDTAAGRFALWRSAVSPRRLLIVLDNAVHTAQVMPLLPPSPGCLVLVTGRARLVDLDGAEWTSLGVMDPRDSAELIAAILGRQRPRNEAAATAELAELCGHLPLALRLMASRLRNRAHWSVGYMVERLRDDARRLDELKSGERSVAATLRLSYQAMDDEHRTAFRLLGLHTGREIDVFSAAAVLDTSAREAEDILERLLDVHLVQEHGIGLYSFHDLVRSYAQRLREKATRADDRAAVGRLAGYYVMASQAACDVLFPKRMRIVPEPGEAVYELPPVAGEENALAWLDREQNALAAAVRLAAEWSLPLLSAQLARNVVSHLNLRGLHRRYLEIAAVGAQAARAAGDPVLLHLSLSNLAVCQWKLGRFHDGITAAAEALESARSCGDPHSEGFSLHILGMLHGATGNLNQAHGYLKQGMAIHHETGQAPMEAQALTHFSEVCTWLGRFPEAADAAEQAVAINRRLGNPDNEAIALADLAAAYVGLGREEEAHCCLSRARELCQAARRPEHLALILALSADVCDRRGRTREADEHARRALDLARRTETPIHHSAIENLMGVIHQRRGEHRRARDAHQRAHDTARTIQYRIEMAYALEGLAAACEALGERRKAHTYRTRALAHFCRMGIPAEHRRRA